MALLEQFHDFLRRRALPLTEQRAQVARVLFSTHKHVSVEDIVERLRGDGVLIGKATVYRTLDLLVESGLVREHDFGEGFKRYEFLAAPGPHEHLICDSCGKVIEFTSAEVEDLKRELSRTHNFTPREHRLEIYGLCEDCRDRAEQTAGPGSAAPKAVVS